MIGAMFRLGEQKVRPGVYVRWYNDGGSSAFGGSTGVAAAVVSSDWGKLKGVTKVQSLSQIEKLIGTEKGSKVVEQIVKGGATEVLVVRVGSGGEVGQLTLDDDEGEDSIKLSTKYPTTRDFNVTLRDSLKDDEKEFILYEGSKVLEKFVIPTGNKEASVLHEELKDSDYLDSNVSNDSALENVVNQKLSGGENPDTVASDYTDAFELLDKHFFDGLTVDAEDSSIHSSLNAYVNRGLQEGSRFIGVVGESVSTSLSDRLSNAKSFNNFAMVYVGNGFVEADVEIDGSLAAARVLGEMVSGNYKDSLTKREISGSTDIVGDLTPNEYIEAAESGMMVFSESVNGLAQIDYGINTLISVGSDEDEGWKKIRRVRTRFELIDRIAFTIDNAMRAGVDNNNDGRQYLITLANGIIAEMIADGGLESGEMIIDEDNPPHGDSVWYKFDELVDLDGIEKVYLAFGFRY